MIVTEKTYEVIMSLKSLDPSNSGLTAKKIFEQTNKYTIREIRATLSALQRTGILEKQETETGLKYFFSEVGQTTVFELKVPQKHSLITLRILDLLQQSPCSIAEIAKTFNISTLSVELQLKMLLTENKIKQQGEKYATN